ncbi:amidase signature domain-containing protein [Hygrophoropsis aurantiaca]|uniref:Amidase signature domain-containing protein n=1 Tax=Hygrophoropsis aurantiaca TaxID=72124 RepID=A0ACB8AAS5_9AGAM|nr:amidase signature domain-containing protein [Hygrophoropsis aurantiaca]
MGDIYKDEQPLSDLKGFPDLYEASIADLQSGLEKGAFTSVDLIKAYLARIDEVNLKGPALHAVIETNPQALVQAAALDAERRENGSRGPLHGIPIILKDNIATLHEEGSTSVHLHTAPHRSHALFGSIVPRDAFVAAKLRAAGAIFVAKSNLSEWANMRGTVPNGWSGRGGQTTCPYYPNADASGSSTGSGVAMAIGLAAGSLGTETDGSIISPSSKNNIVGIKPTVGLTSRAGVIPISHNQDTAGPMCRSVADAASMLSVIAGPDPTDEATLSQPKKIPNYMEALKPDALKGARLGVPRSFFDVDKATETTFNASLEVFRKLGAEIVDPADFEDDRELKESKSERLVLAVDFKVDVKKYIDGLAKVPTGVKDLADLISFNSSHADLELIPPYHDDQSEFITSDKTTVDEAYHAALAEDLDLGRTRGIDATLKRYNLDAILLPTDCASKPPAIAGYPVVTVPLGFQPEGIEPRPRAPPLTNLVEVAPGVPFGISFLGTAYSEFQLIGYAYAFEQATKTRLVRKAYPEAIPKTQLKDVVG